MSFAAKISAAAAAATSAQVNKPPGGSYGAQAPSQYGAPPGGQYGQPSGGAAAAYYGGATQQTQQPNYGAPQQNYGAPYGQPPSSQYGAPPGPGGRPPTGQYGAPALGQPPYGGQQQSPYGVPSGGQSGQPPQGAYGQPQQSLYGGAPPPTQGGIGQIDPNAITQVLQNCVREQHIEAFYQPQMLQQLAQRISQSGAIERLMAEFKIPKELATDFVKLACFDTIILVDDSGSMAFEENGDRITELKLILQKIAFAASLFDHDGIQVRFLNSQVQGNNINSEQAATQLISQISFSGLTPLGTALDQKILQPLVLGPARSQTLRKPVLIVAISDGTPAGEAPDHVFKVIANASAELSRTPYGKDALSIMFSQVGNDLKARDWLAQLDQNPQVGGLVDSCSNYEVESAEVMKITGIELSPFLWICKLCLGAIDRSYDSKDDSTHASGGQAPYGAPGGQAPYGAPGGQAPYGAPGGQAPYGAPGGQAPYGAPGGQAPYGAPPRPY